MTRFSASLIAVVACGLSGLTGCGGYDPEDPLPPEAPDESVSTSSSASALSVPICGVVAPKGLVLENMSSTSLAVNLTLGGNADTVEVPANLSVTVHTNGTYCVRANLAQSIHQIGASAFQVAPAQPVP
jgi:hypothetical protein